MDQSSRKPAGANFEGRKFRNEYLGEKQDNDLFMLLRWLTSGRSKPWVRFLDDSVKADFSGIADYGAASVSFINHATSVIQTAGLTVVTDPVFSERVSPFRWMGPKRRRKAGASLGEIPKTDVVVVSHNHYDHMDITSLAAIQAAHQPLILVPAGNRKHLGKVGDAKIVELDWWESVSVNGSEITLVPMQHWSLRGFGGRREALWGGFVIESNGLKILFAGDTGYNSHFRSIREKFGEFDISLLPIGAYEPRWFMKKFHMNPEEALRAHLDLASALSIAIHFGTFKLSDEGMEDPVTELRKALHEKALSETQFRIPKNGETIIFRK